MEATTLTPAQVTEFVVGELYSMRSVCDHEAIWTFRVIARTAKRLVLQSSNCVQAEEKTEHIRCGIKIWDGRETCLPLGRYSMAPILRA